MEAVWIVTVILSVVASLCWTSGAGGSDAICTVKEWFGGKSVMTGAMVDGNHSLTNTMTIYYYSALKSKMRTYPMFGKQSLIYDYPAKTLYTITYEPNSPTTCTKTPLGGPFPEICLPAHYKVTVDPHTQIGAGNYVTYGWEALSTMGTLMQRMTMSPNMLPIYEEVYGLKDGGAYFQNVYYFNTTQVSFTDAVFTPPKECLQ